MSKGCKPLLKLLGLAEELLFSFPLPSDVVRKYEDVRNIAFTKVGLVSNAASIWKMQRDVFDLVSKKDTRSTQTDSCATQSFSPSDPTPFVDPALKLQEVSSAARVMNLELVSSVESAYALLSRQQNRLNTCVLSLVQVSAKLFSMAGKDDCVLDGIAQVQANSEKLSIAREARNESMEELEEEHKRTMEECRKIEVAYETALEEISRQMTVAEGRVEDALRCYLAALEASNEEASRIEQERISQLSEEVKDKESLASRVIAMKKQMEAKDTELREHKKAMKKKMKSRLQEKLQAQAQEHILTLQSFDAGKVTLARTMSTVDEAVSVVRTDMSGQLEQLHREYGIKLRQAAEEAAEERGKRSTEVAAVRDRLEEELHLRERELAAAKAEVAFLTETQQPTAAKTKVAHKETQAAPPQGEEVRPENTQLLVLIEEKLQKLYQRHASQQKTWLQTLAARKEQLVAKYYSLTDRVQLLLYADFALEFGDKMARDRIWLADKLTMLARENEQLAFRITTSGMNLRRDASQRLKDKVQEDMKNTSEALKEFETARTSLLSKMFPDYTLSLSLKIMTLREGASSEASGLMGITLIEVKGPYTSPSIITSNSARGRLQEMMDSRTCKQE